MRKLIRGVTVATFVSCLAGCSVVDQPTEDDDGSSDGSISGYKACPKLLDRPAHQDLMDLMGSNKISRNQKYDTSEPNKVAAVLRKSLKQTSSSQRPMMRSVCSFYPYYPTSTGDIRASRDEVDVRFGWSSAPKKAEEGYSRKYFAAGSALMYIRYGGTTDTTIYFSCTTPERESGVLRGELRGGHWNIDDEFTAKDRHQQMTRIVLVSAESMSKAIGCTNSPSFPPSKLNRLSNDEVSIDGPLPTLPKSGDVKP